uniref:phytanoyl-CoA dioxygenase family protein n=1 Tax=Halomonas sp. TaxID=1486246 RepID=UPI002612CEEB|nr:phytanoyl-CoA dioxygenase family protein [Halomonas sp.]
MSVTSSNHSLTGTSSAVVADVEEPQCSAHHWPNTKSDPYPTRLHRPLDMPWLHRHEKVVKGSAEDGPLTQAQLDTFASKGFLFEPGFIVGEELDELCNELAALLQSDEYRGRDFSITEPDSDEIRSLFAVHLLSQRFQQLAHDSRLLGRVEQILGGKAYVHQSRINYKPAFEGKGFYWHSDFETWHAEDGMPAMHAVSASIVLTNNHAFNGPLMLIPGSHRVFIPCLGKTPEENHKRSLKVQEIGVPSRDVISRLVARHGIEAPTGAAGGLLLFDCNTLHGSNANMSPDPRSNVFFVYNRWDNRCLAPYAATRPRPGFLAHSPGESGPWHW